MTDERRSAAEETLLAAQNAGDPLMGNLVETAPAAEPDMSADDKWLMENQGEPGNEDDDGWVVQDEAEHTASDDVDEGEDEAEHTADPEPTVPDDAELQRAKSALARDGVPASVLKAMSAEEVRTWGLKRDKVHADTDRVYGELKEIRSKLNGESPGTSEHTEPTPRIDLSAALKPLVDDLGLEGKAEEALVRGLQEAVNAAVSPLKDENAQLRAQVTRVAQTHAQAETEKARQHLAEHFPGVSDQAKWDAVLTRADGLAKSGSYTDAMSCLRDACKIELFDAAAPATSPEVSRQRTRSQPTTTTRRTAPARALTRSEREDLWLRTYDETGGDTAKAAAAYRS